jgi:hypothetical protein
MLARQALYCMSHSTSVKSILTKVLLVLYAAMFLKQNDSVSLQWLVQETARELWNLDKTSKSLPIGQGEVGIGKLISSKEKDGASSYSISSSQVVLHLISLMG